MTIILIIIGATFLAGLLLVLTTRMVLCASRRRETFEISLTILGCGALFFPGQNRLGIVCGKYRHKFAAAKDRPSEKKISSSKKKKASPKSKPKRKYPLSIWVKIARALVLFAGRFMAGINYDGGQFRARPVISNPALAGMAYGWGEAFYGIFPGARQTVDVTPSFQETTSNWSGHMTVSMNIRQIVYLVYRLLRDLPIYEIIKHRFFKRGA